VNKLAAVLLIGVLIGTAASAGTSHPLANVALEDNSDGWFTTSNLEAYGDDLDERVAASGSPYILTGHPAYLIEADRAKLLFDMPRAHYFAISWNNTSHGDRFFANMTAAIRDGRAHWAINNTMTGTMMEKNSTLATAYEDHYCRVEDAETAELYDQTDSTLLIWVPHEDVCPPERRPDV